MQRRTFITAGAGALAVALGTAGCSGGADDGAGSTGDDGAKPSSGAGAGAEGALPAAPAGLKALATAMDGTLVRPGDSDWSSARQLYNTRFDGLRPNAVAYVSHADDIRTALSYAHAHKVAVAVRSGGHSYAGQSSGDGRLVIDVSRMAGTEVNGSEAVVGTGARLIDVYRTLAAKGVTIPAGSCPTVGVAGLALGGGHGVVSRAYGLTCDSLTEATVVTADGRELTANAKEHSDLFWALRGAGNGNFGVVTRLRFRTHPAPPGTAAYLTWPWSLARQVLTAWQEWGPDQADEIWSAAHFDGAPGRTPTVSVSAFSLGTYGDLQNAVDRLADRVGAAASNASLRRRSYRASMEVYAGCSSYSDPQCHLPGPTPGRAPEGVLERETYAARSDFFDRSLPEAGVRTLLSRLESVSGSKASVALTALGGAVNRVGTTATAFVHRRSRMLAQYYVSWPSDGSGTAAQHWLDGAHRAMRPHASGAAYQNYADPTLTDWRSAYYGAAAERLAEVKKTYDPQRFFRSVQGL